MKETINESQFIHAFDEYNRGNNFSYDGRAALFEYLSDYEESTGQELELDVIAFCCEFTEYENIQEYNDDYGAKCESIDEIEDKTTVIRIDDERFIIQDY